jgi:COP9 signalosome complex subunit 4
VEEQDAVLREIVADAYEAEEEYVAAAKVLQGIHLDSSQRLISDDAKVRMWIRIVRLYLEEDDTTSAESFLNKIKNMPSKVQDPELKLHFQLSQARIFDARRRFLDASQEYLNVSLAAGVDEGDRLHALSAAIVCAVLAPAGPQRSRTLSRLYKDDRASSLDVYSILEKIFMDRLLTTDEVNAFAAKLVPHQLAQTADGSTVLDKAVIEHNLLAASRLYEDISVEALGAILGIKASGDLSAAEKAENYAARMLQQGRLKGSIDQIEGVIYFESEAPGISSADARGPSSKLWDAGVQGVAEEVERVAASIMDQFPVSIDVR